MGENSNISFFKDGFRLDGRRADQFRPVKIEVGVLARADGSCYIEMGGNKVIAAVYGPREVHPRHLQEVTRAIVRYRYNMASFSVEERKRPGPDRRSIEISKVSREALEGVVMEELYPRSRSVVFTSATIARQTSSASFHVHVSTRPPPIGWVSQRQLVRGLTFGAVK